MLLALFLFIFIEFYLFACVIIPYLRFDQFLFWDAAGHYFLAWFERNYVFPGFSGWNPFFYCGYPHDTFYGPVYHYVIALLSFPLGLPLSFKLINAASTAILPFAFYFFARKFKFDPRESAVFAFLGMLPVAGLNLACGGTLFSQYIVGLGTNALGLPLFFFYIGKLKEQIDLLSRGGAERTAAGDFAVLTVLSTVLILTHFVAALAAVITALIFIAYSINKRVLAFVFNHALTTFLTAAFFLLPIAAYSKFTEDASTILSMGFFLSVPVFLLIVFGGAAGAMDKDLRFDRAYFTLLAAFAIILFLDFGQLGLPMHAYRFVIYFMVFAMLLPVKMLINNIADWRAKLFFLLISLVLIGWQFVVLVLPNPRAEINYNRLFVYKEVSSPYAAKIDLGQLEGRTMLLEQPGNLTPRASEHRLALASGKYFLKGMIGDNLNSGYINLLHTKMFGLLTGGADKNSPEYFWRAVNIFKLFKLFQINNLLTEFPIKNAKLIRRVPLRLDKPDYYLYKIGAEKVAELVAYRPFQTVKNWKIAVYQWAESPDPRILVKAENLPKEIALAGDKIEIIEETISPARLKLKVSAKRAVPILIKISYFPRWQAKVNGRPTKIYQVAPGLMLVYGSGDVELAYGLARADYWGLLFSAVGVFLFIKEFLRLKSENRLTQKAPLL